MHIEIREGFPSIEVIINCPQASDEVSRIEALLRSYDKKLSGSRSGRMYMIDRQDVLYFESVDKRCFIYTAGETYESPLKLYEIEERFPDMGFIRCSKSQIVNIAKILSICPDFGGRLEITLEGGEKMIVSRQYAKSLKERIGLK